MILKFYTFKDYSMSAPFGIQQGSTKNDIKVGEELSRFIYFIPEVSKPHCAFPCVCAQ